MALYSPLFGSHIAPIDTPGSLSGDSSCFVEELQEPSADKNQRPEQSKWKEYFDSGFIQVATAIQNGRPVAYEIHSSIGSIKGKFTHITFKVNIAHLVLVFCGLNYYKTVNFFNLSQAYIHWWMARRAMNPTGLDLRLKATISLKLKMTWSKNSKQWMSSLSSWNQH
jgi:hypothetical protein